MLGAGLGVLGWFARVLYEATQSLRRDLSALEVRIGTDYVRYDRLRDVMEPMVQQLDRIENALTKKVDKP
jgi:hypothetical protein